MENKSTNQVKSKLLNNKAKLPIEMKKEVNGKRLVSNTQITAEIIDRGNKWYKAMTAQGWRETPYGIMPPEEIDNAGFVWQDNQYMIPTEEIIADENSGSTHKGQKIRKPTDKFMAWLKSYNDKMKALSSRVQKVDRQIEEAMQVTDNSIQNELMEEKEVPF